MASVFFVKRYFNRRIDTLERSICKRLDKQGFSHVKREGSLYITKNEQHFRVHLANSFNRKIKPVITFRETRRYMELSDVPDLPDLDDAFIGAISRL